MTTTETQETQTQDLDSNPLLAQLKPFFDAIERNIAQYNSVSAQLAAAEGDRDAAIQSWMDSANDGDATALRNVIKEATERLRTLAEAAVGDTQVSEEEKARIKAAKDEAEKLLRASSKAVRGLADPFNLDVTPILRRLGDPFTPKQATGTGSSLPRPTVYVKCMRNHDPKQTMTFDTLGAAAKHMDYDLEQLGRQYAKVGGKPYEEVAKIDHVVTFEWQNPNLKDAKHWTIEITPKESSRGRTAVQAVAESATPDAATPEPKQAEATDVENVA